MAGRVTPERAHALTTDEGWSHVDVRTVPEFEAGHPEGAFNVPFLVDGPRGRAPNERFVDGIRALFPTHDAKLVLGCQTANRSARAAELLEAAGYGSIVVQLAGWGGASDPFGRITTAGWKAAGLPVATRARPGRAWAEIEARIAPDTDLPRE